MSLHFTKAFHFTSPYDFAPMIGRQMTVFARHDESGSGVAAFCHGLPDSPGLPDTRKREFFVDVCLDSGVLTAPLGEGVARRYLV
jgi:hypothetical protein